ncbi:MAG: hypothetical protein HC880_12470, partial [Bacteroidia bacterium]|nr:hypothetical protein [Bacteroidia bacterium]
GIQVEGSSCEARTPIPTDPGSKSIFLAPLPDPVIASDNGGLGPVCAANRMATAVRRPSTPAASIPGW